MNSGAKKGGEHGFDRDDVSLEARMTKQRASRVGQNSKTRTG